MSLMPEFSKPPSPRSSSREEEEFPPIEDEAASVEEMDLHELKSVTPDHSGEDIDLEIPKDISFHSQGSFCDPIEEARPELNPVREGYQNDSLSVSGTEDQELAQLHSPEPPVKVLTSSPAKAASTREIQPPLHPTTEPGWRKPGQLFRARLLAQDQQQDDTANNSTKPIPNANAAFTISNDCPLSRYYQVADKVRIDRCDCGTLGLHHWTNVPVVPLVLALGNRYSLNFSITMSTRLTSKSQLIW
jgi:hypothetical protein